MVVTRLGIAFALLTACGSRAAGPAAPRVVPAAPPGAVAPPPPPWTPRTEEDLPGGVEDLVVHQGRLWVLTGSGRTFRMPTCGVGANAAPEAWSDVSVGTLITSLVSTPSTLYAAGEDGVYRYAAAGWSPLDAGLPSSTSHRIVELTGDPDGLVVVVQVPDASQVYPPKQAYRLGADGTWAPFGPRLAPEDDVIAAEPTGLWVDSFGLVSMSVGVEHTLSWVPLTGARVEVAAREPGTNVRFVVEGDTLVRIAWPTGTDATEVPHTVSTSVDRGQTWRAVEPAMSMVPILATTPAGLALFAGDELLTSPDLQRWTSVSTTGLPGGEPETAVACGGDLLVSFEGASTIYARRIDRVEP